MKKIRRILALILALVALASFAACGSKDVLAGKWKGELGADGTVTWEFDGKGKCKMQNEFTTQSGEYSINGNEVTITLELWDEPNVYTFSVDGDKLTMDDTDPLGLSGTYAKQ